VSRRVLGSVKKFGAWIITQLAQLLLPTVLLWLIAALGSLRVWAHSKNVPLWIVIILLIPASFGTVVFFRRYFRPIDFQVTADPVKSIISEAAWGNEPAVQLLIEGTFANGEKHDLLLLYAYLKGSEPLMHFMESLHIPPESAIEARVMGFCTRPEPIKNGRYDVNVVFVDAGKRKYRQRLSMRGVSATSATPSPQTASASTSA
jgi:hypothetical protein